MEKLQGLADSSGQRLWRVKKDLRSLSRCAGRWMPFGAIRLLLEVRAREKLAREVLGIVDQSLHDQVLFPVRFPQCVEILGRDRISAVGRAVLAQTPGFILVVTTLRDPPGPGGPNPPPA
jgi:hypothetical protein